MFGNSPMTLQPPGTRDLARPCWTTIPKNCGISIAAPILASFSSWNPMPTFEMQLSFHESLTSAVWKQVDDISCRPAAPTRRPAADNPSSPRCSHCCSKEAHEALGVSPQCNECPSTKLAAAKARVAAKELVAAIADDPKLDVSAKVKLLCNAHK